MEIIIDNKLNNEYFWKHMFSMITNEICIKYIIYKNKIYFNCSNSWYDFNLQSLKKYTNLKIAHDDLECDGYDECDSDVYNSIATNIDEIEYKFKWCGDFDLEILETTPKIVTNIKKVQNIFCEMKKNKLKLKDVKFISHTPLEIKNECGFNTDHRGSDHTILKLPFLNKINLQNEFTLYDLVCAYTHLKSHKFDNWYELFSEVKLRKTEKKTIIKLDFDHGS